MNHLKIVFLGDPDSYGKWDITSAKKAWYIKIFRYLFNAGLSGRAV